MVIFLGEIAIRVFALAGVYDCLGGTGVKKLLDHCGTGVLAYRLPVCVGGRLARTPAAHALL